MIKRFRLHKQIIYYFLLSCFIAVLACTKTIRQDVYEYVTVTDTLGTVTVFDTTFSYQTIPPIIPVLEYPRIAVVPVKADGFDETEALYYTDAIENWFVNIGHYTVVSRSNVDRIIAEQDLHQTGRFDNTTLANMGKILGADAIIATTLYRTRNSYFWSIKVIDSENGIVLWGADGDDRFSDVFPEVLEPIQGGRTRSLTENTSLTA